MSEEVLFIDKGPVSDKTKQNHANLAESFNCAIARSYFPCYFYDLSDY